MNYMEFGRIVNIIYGKGKGQAIDDATADAANVLLQLVLPIVLILAFIIEVVGQIGKLEDVLLELEKQKLVAALEKVKSERRVYFGIDSAKGINITDGKLTDPYFKATCEKANDSFRDSRSRQNEVNSLYEAVLQTAEITNVAPENSEFVKEQIQAFIKSLIDDIVKLQIGAFNQISDYFLQNTDELDRLDTELARLRELYNKATNESEKSAYANRLYNRFHEWVKSYLEKDDYYFLEEAWQVMRL